MGLGEARRPRFVSATKLKMENTAFFPVRVPHLLSRGAVDAPSL